MDLRITREKAVRGLIGPGVWIALYALLLTPGCGGLLGNQRQERDTEFTVVPFSNNSALALDGEDVVRVMEIAGFTPQQIWKLGADLRNALMQSGGAKMRLGKKQVEVIYAVRGDHVWIQSRTRNLFVYDVKSKQFNLGPGAETSSPDPVPPPQSQAPQPYEQRVPSVRSSTR